MARVEMVVDVSDPMAVARVVAERARALPPAARRQFWAEWDALCDRGDVVKLAVDGKQLVASVSPEAFRLLARHGLLIDGPLRTAGGGG